MNGHGNIMQNSILFTLRVGQYLNTLTSNPNISILGSPTPTCELYWYGNWMGAKTRLSNILKI